MNIATLSITAQIATSTAYSSYSSFGQTPTGLGGGASGLAKPTTQAQLQALLQGAMNGKSVMFDPTTSVSVSSTMTPVRSGGGLTRRQDFTDIPDHEFFIRRIGDVGEISQHVLAVAAEEPRRLCVRLEIFKQRCAEVFSWQRAARSLLTKASSLASST